MTTRCEFLMHKLVTLSSVSWTSRCTETSEPCRIINILSRQWVRAVGGLIAYYRPWIWCCDLWLVTCCSVTYGNWIYKADNLERWRIYEKWTIAMELKTSNKLYITTAWKTQREVKSHTDNKSHGNSVVNTADDDHKTIIDIIIKALMNYTNKNKGHIEMITLLMHGWCTHI